MYSPYLRTRSPADRLRVANLCPSAIASCSRTTRATSPLRSGTSAPAGRSRSAVARSSLGASQLARSMRCVSEQVGDDGLVEVGSGLHLTLLHEELHLVLEVGAEVVARH